VKFQECNSLYELYQRKPENPEDRRFISLSQCGFRDGQALVCCHDAVSGSRIDEPSDQPVSIIPITQAPSFFLIPTPGGDNNCGIYAEPRIHLAGEVKWFSFLFLKFCEILIQ
jgi:hypothetical protein